MIDRTRRRGGEGARHGEQLLLVGAGGLVLAVVALAGGVITVMMVPADVEDLLMPVLILLSAMISGGLIVGASLMGISASLRREDERQRQERHDRLQLELLDRARRWATRVSRRTGRIWMLVHEGAAKTGAEGQRLLQQAEDDAQQFYDSGEQDLREAAFLAKALDDEEAPEAVEALREIDGLLRQMNEELMGDPEEPLVHIIDQLPEAVETLSATSVEIGRRAERIEDCHARWVK